MGKQLKNHLGFMRHRGRMVPKEMMPGQFENYRSEDCQPASGSRLIKHEDIDGVNSYSTIQDNSHPVNEDNENGFASFFDVGMVSNHLPSESATKRR